MNPPSQLVFDALDKLNEAHAEMLEFFHHSDAGPERRELSGLFFDAMDDVTRLAELLQMHEHQYDESDDEPEPETAEEPAE